VVKEIVTPLTHEEGTPKIAPLDDSFAATKATSSPDEKLSARATDGKRRSSKVARDGHMVTMRRVSNPAGPVPVWIMHDPFWFDIGAHLDCPITIPLYELRGFRSIATTSSSRHACLTFGISDEGALIGVLSNLHLDGLSFDETNHLLSLVHGTIGHQNIHFLNLFTAFNTATMYNKDVRTKKDGKFVLVKDYVDFHGGSPRFAFPLLPSTILDVDESDREVGGDGSSARSSRSPFGMGSVTPKGQYRFKHGWFDTKRNRAYTTVLDILNEFSGEEAEPLGYAYWGGPSLPTRAECSMGQQACCDLVGISNPVLPHMARQMGMDGFNIAYCGTYADMEYVSSTKIMSEEGARGKNVSDLILTLSDTLIEGLSRMSFKFSPAIMSVSSSARFDQTIVTDTKLEVMSKLHLPLHAPCYQVLPDVSERWSDMELAAKWLSRKWDFEAKPIKNVVMSHFSFGFRKMMGKELISINLNELPFWRKYFCGGTPYTHFHIYDDNPFEWTLRVYESEKTKTRYAMIAPAVFENAPITESSKAGDATGDLTALEHKSPAKTAFGFPKKGAAGEVLPPKAKLVEGLQNMHKYSPNLWNLEFLVRVLWKCGVVNAVMVAQLFGTNNRKFKLPEKNGVVIVDNYIDCTKWNTLTGPNDERMGPRFVPMTEPMELSDKFIEIVKDEKYGGCADVDLKKVIAVHAPNHALISPLSKDYYAALGLECLVNGFVPCIQTASHVGMNKVAIGILDFHMPSSKSEELVLDAIGNYDRLFHCVEGLFEELEDK
jgi:purine-nucleoside phosphorylase